MMKKVIITHCPACVVYFFNILKSLIPPPRLDHLNLVICSAIFAEANTPHAVRPAALVRRDTDTCSG